MKQQNNTPAQVSTQSDPTIAFRNGRQDRITHNGSYLYMTMPNLGDYDLSDYSCAEEFIEECIGDVRQEAVDRGYNAEEVNACADHFTITLNNSTEFKN